jgi:hypothetical protein
MWPFTRKPKPLNPGPINEDWRVGDLAECLFEGAWFGGNSGNIASGLDKGDVSKVLAIGIGRTKLGGDRYFLTLGGFRGEFDASCFRKVPPLNSEADAEFTAKIKALKPKRVRA